MRGRAKVIGVEPEGAPTLTTALAAGEPVDAPAGGIAADSLAPRRVGELVFPIARDHVERVVLVTDEAIRGGPGALWEQRCAWSPSRAAPPPSPPLALRRLPPGAGRAGGGRRQRRQHHARGFRPGAGG